MPKAVVFGAGNIGRGFLGQIFAESGWDLVFIEVNQDLIAALNARGGYPIRIVSDEETTDFFVRGVRAVAPDDPAAVAELAGADLAATAVGVHALPGIAPTVAAALLLRARSQSRAALDIIVCENMIGADRLLRAEVARCLPSEATFLLARLGLVEASIGRMVPAVSPERRAEDPLRVWVEPYCELPVDAAGFRGPVPSLAHLLPSTPFGYHIESKLFLHNAGHALAAYLGYLAGQVFIWQAMQDEAVRADVSAGMTECARALSLAHGIPLAVVRARSENLQHRFANRALGDTVARVGHDPVRKLGPADRLVGAARLIQKQGGDPASMAKGIAAALYFQATGDESAARLREMLRVDGLERTIEQVCRIEREEPLAVLVSRFYQQCNRKKAREHAGSCVGRDWAAEGGGGI